MPGDRAKRGGRDVLREARRVDQSFAGDHVFAVAQVPRRVDHGRHYDDEPARPRTPVEQLDEHADEHRDAEAGAADRDDDCERSGSVAEAVVALEQHPRRETAGDREHVVDLKRPQEVFPGRAEEQDQRGREQRGNPRLAFRDEHEDERRAAQVQRDQHEAENGVVIQTDDVEEHLVDGHREHRHVTVVREQQRVYAAAIVVDYVVPVVEEERQPPTHVKQQQRVREQ